MKSAQRREDALTQSGISGLAEALDEAGDDFGCVHHGEGAERTVVAGVVGAEHTAARLVGGLLQNGRAPTPEVDLGAVINQMTSHPPAQSGAAARDEDARARSGPRSVR